MRLYAIEVDRATERYETVYEKADSYRSVRNDPSFYERYGCMFPVLLVTVPGESRRTGWHAGWKQRWPYGRWPIATKAGLARDQWFEYHDGVERWRTFVDNWQPAPIPRDAAGREPAEQAGQADAHQPVGVAPDPAPVDMTHAANRYWARLREGVDSKGPRRS